MARSNCKAKSASKDAQTTTSRKKTGTREWAVVNVNIVTGCEHRCRYCYAAEMAKRFGRMSSLDEWGEISRLRPEEVAKKRRKQAGPVMFPSTHDITPQFIEECVTVLRKLLEAGNDVVIVTKPHLECVKRLCQELAAYKEQIVFRFTIGAMDDELLRFWEPGAPAFAERLEALQFAYERGFQTSVSAEPMLDMPHAVELYNTLVPFITETIWFGKMNQVRKRVAPKSEEEEAAVKRIEENQTDACIRALYEELKDAPNIEWKDSVKEVVGLPPEEEPESDN